MCYVSYVFFNIKYSFVFIIADLHFLLHRENMYGRCFSDMFI